jgi:tetratricopeptide (TPR) repeat protein
MTHLFLRFSRGLLLGVGVLGSALAAGQNSAGGLSQYNPALGVYSSSTMEAAERRYSETQLEREFGSRLDGDRSMEDYRRGKAALKDGYPAEAEKYLRRAEESFSQRRASSLVDSIAQRSIDLQAANAASQLSAALFQQGKLDESQKFSERALQLYQRNLNPADRIVLETMRSIANFQVERGQLPQAREILSDALNRCEHARECAALQAATLHLQLSEVERRAQQMPQALEQAQAAVNFFDSEPQQPLAPHAWFQVGVLLSAQGNPAAGEQYLRRAVQRFESAPNSNGFVDSSYQLGAQLALSSEPQHLPEARRWLERSAAANRKYRRNPELLALTLNALAAVYWLQRDSVAAINTLYERLQLNSPAQDAEGITASLNLELAQLLQWHSAQLQALYYYDRAARDYAERLGSEHEKTVDARFVWAAAAVEAGQYAQAEPVLRTTREFYRRTCTADDQKVSAVDIALAAALHGLGQDAEAQALLLASAEAPLPRQQVSMPRVHGLRLLGEILEQQSADSGRVEALYRTAWELGQNFPPALDFVTVSDHLGRRLIARGELDAAQTVVERAYLTVADKPRDAAVVSLMHLLWQIAQARAQEAVANDYARRILQSCVSPVSSKLTALCLRIGPPLRKQCPKCAVPARLPRGIERTFAANGIELRTDELH